MESRTGWHTLVYITPPQQILNEFISKTDYKTKEFVPIYSFMKRSFAMTVNNETWKTVDEFIKEAKARPLSIGLSGFGSASHIEALSVVKAWGIKVKWVPYDTGAEALTQLAGKRIDAAFTAAATAIPLMKAGKIRALLKFSHTPVDGFENVPDPAKLGYHIPIMSEFGGIVAPPKTPAQVIKILEEACNMTVKDPEFLEWAAKAKYEVIHLNSDGFRKEILAQYKIVEENISLIRESMPKE